jgi:hypothetical protein
MRRPSWLRRLLLRLAGEPLPPTPSDRASHFLAVEDAWPWAPALARLRRWLTGRPERSPTDAQAMRADALRIGERVGRSALRHGPTGTVDAGLQGLVARTLERVRARGRRQTPRLVHALGSATRAQALLNRRVVASESAGDEVLLRRREIPEPPRLGVVLTGRVAHVGVIFLLLVPLEAFLTFPTLQVLTYTDLMTQRLCVLIGLAIAIGAEAAASMLAHVARDGERRDPARRGLYYVTALLAVAAVVGGFVALDQMAGARQHNEALAYAIKHGYSTGATTSSSAATAGGGSAAGFSDMPGAAPGGGAATTSGSGGFANVPGGAGSAGGSGPAVATGPPGAGAGAAGGAAGGGATALAPAPGTPDLRFMLALQVFAFIAALIFALRVHVAAPYRGALRRLGAAERRVRRRTWAVGRADRRVARTRATLDEAQRDIRLGAREEIDRLGFLLSRVRERHDQQFRDGHPPPIELPVLPDVDELVRELLEPEHPLLGQPDVAEPAHGQAPPRATPPPPPMDDPAGGPADASSAPPREAPPREAPPDAGAQPEDEPPDAAHATARDGEMSELLRDLEERLFPRRGSRSAAGAAQPSGGGGATYERVRPQEAGEEPVAAARNGGPSELDDEQRVAAARNGGPSELDDEQRVAAARNGAPSELDDEDERLDGAQAAAYEPRRPSELDDDGPDPGDDPLAAVD